MAYQFLIVDLSLDYIGAQDANCPWPGILSFVSISSLVHERYDSSEAMISQLKLLRTPFQDEFLTAKDAPWPTSDIATVRTVGKGAGNMTFVLIQEAGHFVRSFRVSLVLLTMLMNKMFGFVDCS